MISHTIAFPNIFCWRNLSYPYKLNIHFCNTVFIIYSVTFFVLYTKHLLNCIMMFVYPTWKLPFLRTKDLPYSGLDTYSLIQYLIYSNTKASILLKLTCQLLCAHPSLPLLLRIWNVYMKLPTNFTSIFYIQEADVLFERYKRIVKIINKTWGWLQEKKDLKWDKVEPYDLKK